MPIAIVITVLLDYGVQDTYTEKLKVPNGLQVGFLYIRSRHFVLDLVTLYSRYGWSIFLWVLDETIYMKKNSTIDKKSFNARGQKYL